MKYFSLLKFELRNTIRDKMNAMLFFYPFITLLLTIFLFPILLKNPDIQNASMEVTMVILILTIISFGYLISSVLLGFSLLDNKDENVLQTISVTPISKKGYINFKITYSYVYSVLSTIIIFALTKLLASNEYVLVLGEQTIFLFDQISYFQIFVVSLSSSLLVPAIALLIVAISKNKIEGFAYMKASGLIMLIPMLVLLPTFQGGGQYLLSLAPNFWISQAVLNAMLPQMFYSSANLSFYLYILIGSAISVVYSIVCYRLYMKKVQ